MTIAELALSLAALYAGPGLFLAPAFLLRATRIDHRFADSPFRVRVLMLPGVITVWPVVLMRLVRPTGGGVS